LRQQKTLRVPQQVRAIRVHRKTGGAGNDGTRLHVMVRERVMDDEREPDGVARKASGWLWLVGIGLTAAAFYWAIPAGHGRPTSVTVFGVNAPDAPVASYPGLRLPPQSQLASAEALR
jgi:hypothetical protein